LVVVRPDVFALDLTLILYQRFYVNLVIRYLNTWEHAEMSMTDPIADMLTRIRNANIARHESTMVPASRLKEDIARILQEEGYIKSYKYLEDQKQGMLLISLKYSGSGRERIISQLKRISKPGRRVYVSKTSLPRVLNGMGTAIVSTSRGVMTASQCRRAGVGGEIVCHVW
jgi:small subunit ribosomal protein S8